MNQIIPTVFSTNKEKFDERFNKLVKISKDIQIDFMDGYFVGNESILLKRLPNLKKYKINFEIHLMAKNPEKYIDEAKKLGFKKIIFHYESLWDNKNCLSLIKKIKSLKMKAFIALSPETSSSKITPLLKSIDGVLLMGVHPGAEHQEIIPRTYAKIKEIRKYSKTLPIQIDGGVNLATLKKLKESGATIFNSGSFISNSSDPKKALKQLEND
jgi:ribulose-phosphate 3-epimerase